MQFTVAIDGPAAAGKGTISRLLAAHFNFRHLDTGMLYRAVGVRTMHLCRGVIDEKVAAKVASTLSHEDLNRTDLRSARASRSASKVATLPAVRDALLIFQRDFAQSEGGAVLDGRDIGTVICPDADAKLFVTASPEIRAERRFQELTKSGAKTSLEAVAADLALRDARDRERETAPLIPAEDAHLLDTSDLSIETAVAKAVAIIEKRIERGRV